MKIFFDTTPLIWALYDLHVSHERAERARAVWARVQDHVREAKTPIELISSELVLTEYLIKVPPNEQADEASRIASLVGFIPLTRDAALVAAKIRGGGKVPTSDGPSAQSVRIDNWIFATAIRQRADIVVADDKSFPKMATIWNKVKPPGAHCPEVYSTRTDIAQLSLPGLQPRLALVADPGE